MFQRTSYRLASIIAVMALLFSSNYLYAQQSTVQGSVVDVDNNPVVGATVLIKNKAVGKTTNEQGEFSIAVANDDVLVFSAIGFQSYEETVGANRTMKIKLQEGAMLGEVVVVGYGTSRRKDLTGSQTTITSKDFQQGVITTPEQLVAGKIAGVSIISNSGRPGDGSTILIRGGSSLSASNAPLIVLDGVPLDEVKSLLY